MASKNDMISLLSRVSHKPKAAAADMVLEIFQALGGMAQIAQLVKEEYPNLSPTKRVDLVMTLLRILDKSDLDDSEDELPLDQEQLEGFAAELMEKRSGEID